MTSEDKIYKVCDLILEYHEMMIHDRDYLMARNRIPASRLYINLINEFQDLYDFAMENKENI